MPSTPPVRNILHLNAMRAFEAAARLGGFAQAANELRVTPGAIASQIKLLETECGAALFVRNPKGVTLTALGLSISENFIQAFDALESAARDLRQKAAPNRVHIVTSPALAQLWLQPRLARISESIGPTDISVTALDDPPNLKRSPFDICLFYTSGTQPFHIRLFEEEVTPVCAPQLAENIRAPVDLLNARCIPDVVWNDWAVWSATTLPGRKLAPDGPSFSLYSVALQQALAGAGVLIGRKSLVEDYLSKGALVAPFGTGTPLGLAITMWTLAGSKRRSAVRDVCAAIRRAV